ncbi:C2 domain-containing protein [Dioscorea alata]|uniref:C2 domain-containing protein n=1 Tax=Dioscorea alata TaxID=55571 RepID=A0ACB7U9U8_DIOAL|nr:C2 domain-containing protein [Dioscorea alata]
MASSRPPPPPKSFDLVEITVVSAKHLKNVNWRHGDLKPYAVVYLDPERRAATKPDDSGSTRPVWNEPSETPKPLVGTARCPLKDLLSEPATALDGSPSPIKTLELRRPSGRPQGKIRIKLAIKDRPAPPPEPGYHFGPPSGYYYSTAGAAPPPPPPQPTRDYSRYSPQPPPASPYSHPIPPQPSQYSYGVYSDPFAGYYSSGAGYYSAPPAPAPAPAPAPTQAPARSYYDRAAGYGGPSAPLDYSSSGPSSYYEQKPKGSRLGMGTGLAVGAAAGALGALALEEGVKYEEGKIADKVETDLAARDDYSDYRADY